MIFLLRDTILYWLILIQYCQFQICFRKLVLSDLRNQLKWKTWVWLVQLNFQSSKILSLNLLMMKRMWMAFLCYKLNHRHLMCAKQELSTLFLLLRSIIWWMHPKIHLTTNKELQDSKAILIRFLYDLKVLICSRDLIPLLIHSKQSHYNHLRR